jgi:hypothetical protein
MEFLFIYFNFPEDHYYKGRFLNKSSITFTNKYEIAYSEEQNSLLIKDNPDYMDKFFGNNIMNITAFVGRNGSGKSTILNYLIEEKLRNVSVSIPESFDILLVEKNNKIYVFCHVEMKSLKDNILDLKFMKNDVEVITYTTHLSWSEVFKQTPFSVIYLSSIFDRNLIHESQDLFFDKSTNTLLNWDREKRTNNLPENINQVQAFNYAEIQRQLRCIVDNREIQDKLEFNIPEYLEITFRKIDEDHLHNIVGQLEAFKDKGDTYKEYRELWIRHKLIIRQLKLKFEYLRTLQITSKYQEYEVIKSVLLNFVCTPINSLTSQIDNWQIIQIAILKVINFNLYNLNFNNFEEFILQTEKAEKSLAVEVGYNIDLYSTALEKYLRVVNFCRDYVSDDNPLAYNILFVDTKEESLHEFIEAYFKSFSTNGYFEFSWRGLSSGENSLYNLFARLNSIKHDYDYENNITDNLLILIDEGELYFHPEWQRKFIHYLINDIPLMFPGKSFQFVITSNSPFVTSDLPSSNVYYLQRDNENLKIESGKECNKVSFASNINTLYADSFYMDEEGFLGEFARRKIDKLFEYFLSEDEKTNGFDEKSAKQLIDMIGDQVIRHELIKLFDKKFKKNVELEFALQQQKRYDKLVKALLENDKNRKPES